MDTQGLGGLLAFAIGWFLAQGGKVLIDILKAGRPLKGKELVDCITRSGGMPSSHTASILSLTVYLGMQYGWESGIFALALAMSTIVIYDAVNVRYAVGEQGKLLNVVIMNQNLKKRTLKVVEGHTVPQVIIGGIIGIVVGLIVGAAL